MGSVDMLTQSQRQSAGQIIVKLGNVIPPTLAQKNSDIAKIFDNQMNVVKEKNA